LEKIGEKMDKHKKRMDEDFKKEEIFYNI